VISFSNYHYFIPTKETGYGLQSNYEIEDLKGDKINTWVSWKITQGDVFHIHVQSSPEVTDDRLNVIRDVIFNNDTVTIDNHTYYKGWSGALEQISKHQTKFPIPIHFHTVLTDFGTGNIVIRLTNLQNGDGYSGYTKSIMDVSNHQILKSEITIYNVNKLSDDELKMIVRHELGHGFGLGHFDDPNDLMYPEIGSGHSYISECDIESLSALYNGDERTQVTCQK